MSVSVIEQARIQAEVLVPLVKALRAELGAGARRHDRAEDAGHALSRLWRGVLAREE